MANSQSTARAHWGTRIGFILATAGSAIGLGNIWKFPYITGVNGGGAFVLIYLLCIAVVGVPVFIAELYIGQKSQKNAVEAFETLHKKKTSWRFTGMLGVLSAFLILSFYSVVGGWILDFLFNSVTNQFSGKSEPEIRGMMGSLFGNPWRQLIWHSFFMAGTVAIVLGGIQNGIEKWNKILMPALLILLGVLLFRSFFLPGFSEALSFLFAPDASKLTGKGILEAVGHSFFTLSLGLGAIITYGSYLGEKGKLVKTAITVAFLDTMIALVAGTVIFSVVFSYGIQPGGGPTLMFQTLPVLFSKMTGSYLVALMFFALVAFAAFTSSVSLLEVVVTYWVESHKKDRRQTVIWVGICVYAVGVLSALSTNVLSDFKMGGLTFFDLFDKLTSSLFLPIGGLFISLFYGWVLGPQAVKNSIENSPSRALLAQGLLWTSRLLAPIAIIWMLVNGLKDWG